MEPVIVSGADAKYYDLLLGAISSALCFFPPAQVVVLDFGLTASQRAHLAGLGVALVVPHDVEAVRPFIQGRRVAEAVLLARAFLPQLLPGRSPIMWLDSDAWIQRKWAADAYLEAAMDADIVAAAERDPRYRIRPRLLLWEWRHLVRSFGIVRGTALAAKPHVNAGIFAARSDSPVWRLWQSTLLQIAGSTGTAAPYDQMVLNHCVYGAGLRSVVLDARFNWICKRRMPMWNTAPPAFSVPDTPTVKTIGIIHLAGVEKEDEVQLPVAAGGTRSLTLRFQAT